MKSVSCGTILLLLLLTQYTLQDDVDQSVTVEVEEDDIYVTPTPIGNPFIAETFDDTQAFKRKWQTSQAKKDGIDEDLAKYDGVWEVEAPLKDGLKNDLGLVLKSKAKHAAISAKLNRPFTFQEKPLIVQYEVNFQEGQECGGAYVKLLSHGSHGPQPNLMKEFTDKTPYTIMFGPDKCGNDIKLHFIFRHLNPNNGSLEEKHCKKPKDRLQEVFDDKRPHLYTLILNPDNTFLIKVDHKIVNEGSLLEDFTPSVNPPAEIDDPNDKKPASWDEREKIVDPEARKPDDWDESAPRQIPDPHASKPGDWLENEPTMLPDPDAEKPADWDTDMDGDWEAPLVDNPACVGLSGCGPWEHPNIDNPAYKGKWRAPLIDNPNYQGKWRPRRIPNPDYFFDGTPFKMTPIGAVGFELWSMSASILFDNIIVADSLEVADDFATKTYDLKKRKIEAESDSVLTAFLKYSNERPYLYGVYILLIGLPIALIVVYCCGTPTRDQDDSREHPKKTDTPQPDSPPIVRSKDDLNVPEEEEEQDEEDEDGDEQGSSPDEDEDEEEDDDDSKDSKERTATPDSTGARQRKPRKE